MSNVIPLPGDGSLMELANTNGLKMGGRFLGKAFGWTTDEQKALLLGRHGARIEPGYNRDGPCGWEVSFWPAQTAR